MTDYCECEGPPHAEWCPVSSFSKEILVTTYAHCECEGTMHVSGCPNNPFSVRAPRRPTGVQTADGRIVFEELVVPLEQPTGWICPRCDRVWAPHVDTCETCADGETQC